MFIFLFILIKYILTLKPRSWYLIITIYLIIFIKRSTRNYNPVYNSYM